MAEPNVETAMLIRCPSCKSVAVGWFAANQWHEYGPVNPWPLYAPEHRQRFDRNRPPPAIYLCLSCDHIWQKKEAAHEASSASNGRDSSRDGKWNTVDLRGGDNQTVKS